jgi:RNA polymerase sigma-70 factor, ECF subfamily
MVSNRAMSEASRREVRAGLEPCLARLWRYALVLSRARDVADDLVQATCVRALERADQYVPRTRVDRWLFAILWSIWLNEIRSRRIREGRGFVGAGDVLTTDGAREIEMNVTASAVLRAIGRLPEAQRETVLLVFQSKPMTEDDAELVALIDNELDEGRKNALLARFAADECLRQHCDELRAAGLPIAASLDALLEAPLARPPPRSLLTAPFESRPADSPGSACATLRLALSSGF